MISSFWGDISANTEITEAARGSSLDVAAEEDDEVDDDADGISDETPSFPSSDNPLTAAAAIKHSAMNT